MKLKFQQKIREPLPNYKIIYVFFLRCNIALQETVSLVFDGFQIEIKINTRLRKENCVLISHIVMLLVVADIQTVVSFLSTIKNNITK